jgi:CubicO group peptidase (beta-lactamase class C family)
MAPPGKYPIQASINDAGFAPGPFPIQVEPDERMAPLGAAVQTRRDNIGPAVGSVAWTGGLGTGWCSDPHEDMVTIFMSQRMKRGPSDLDALQDFFTLAYSAIDDVYTDPTFRPAS